MGRSFKFIVFFLFLSLSFGIVYALSGLRFASGFLGGTYNQIARTMNHLPGMSFEVLETKGSTENINLLKNSQADLAFVQLDVLIESGKDDPAVGRDIKILLPVYREEVHILAAKTINSLQDLKGKKVAIGPDGSGTQATALSILKKLKLDKEISADNSSAEAGLKKLLGNQIDAVFIIAGAPVKILSELNENTSEKFHLLPFSKSEMRNFTSRNGAYSQMILRKNIYPWHAERIETLAVESVLAGKASLSDGMVATIINTIFKNQVELYMSHEKWTELELSFIRKMARRRKILFHPGAYETIFKMKETN